MRARCKTLENIPVSDLQLDLSNFRLGTAENQKECIALLLAEKKDRDHLIHLAKDIALRGLSPAPIIVVQRDDGNLIVRDGNRRITALKLLNNPLESPEQYKSIFVTIARNKTIEIPNSVSCLLTDEETALEIMELEHLGYQNGIGQIDWGTNEKDNLIAFKGDTPQNNIARAICDYLKGIGIGGTEKVKLTIFQRLFQDETVRNEIGIAWDGTNIIIERDEKDVSHILSEILLDFTERNYKTRRIFTAIERANYLEEIFARGVPKAKERDKSQAITPASVDTTTLTSHGSEESSHIGSPQGNGSRPPKKASWDRKRLIPPRDYLPIPQSETKARNIANELSRKIDVKEAPNAAAVLLRLLVEFAVDYFIKKHSLRVKDGDTLAKKIGIVADMLESNQHIVKKQHEQLNRMKDGNILLSTSTLNAWIHNPNFSPDVQVICTFWENIHFFVNLCWTK